MTQRARPPPVGSRALVTRNLSVVFATMRPSIVVSSPLERAVDTARVIAEAAGAARWVDECFKDRDYGPQTGHLTAEVTARWGTVDDAPGMEPAADVLARARPALDALLDDAPGLSVIVVTHDAVIRPDRTWPRRPGAGTISAVQTGSGVS
ncbi:histidine phosphatase family protein [Arthrobacter sp. Y81]|uniref:histidine phosphatase family protein n=1 Tax=Arthrobacter sp. Y81 TaxID=2058897 RepID=UPI002157AB83|nr:histidine phosphatase family protein [Arthrobacter sp. Y81]